MTWVTPMPAWLRPTGKKTKPEARWPVAISSTTETSPPWSQKPTPSWPKSPMLVLASIPAPEPSEWMAMLWTNEPISSPASVA